MFNIRSNFIKSLRNVSLSCLLTNAIRRISFSSPLAFNLTPSLMMMPLKKKRRVDPQILRLRLERKKKKLEREIRLYMKGKKILKPIEEARIPSVLLYEGAKQRQRQVQVPENVKEERILMCKEWSRYTNRQTMKDMRNVRNIIMSQEKALEELRKESIVLYNAAIEEDQNLIPFKYVGPTDTPAIPNYNVPDGSYTDISKNWFENWKPKTSLT